MTLGNFDYQKISLVRDYDSLLEEDVANRAFDALFSAEARPALPGPSSPPPLVDEQFPVVATDATQTATVVRARKGTSFIVQGPPGTGKSQTITNLIADYVARGKRVLFVCEKRAAIDVVYHRLHQLGLDRLTALIHDSQGDKKAFVAALKEFVRRVDGLYRRIEQAAHERPMRRSGARAPSPLNETSTRFDRLMTAPARSGPANPWSRVIRRSIELEPARGELSPSRHRERLPSHGDFDAARAEVDALVRVLTSLDEEPVLARHPARFLHDRVLAAERPIELVSEGPLVRAS